MAPVKQVMKENKLISGLIIAGFAAWLGWAAWVTTGVQDSKHPPIVKGKTIEALCNDIDELKTETSLIKTEAKRVETVLSEKIESNHKEVMRYLITIRSQIQK